MEKKYPFKFLDSYNQNDTDMFFGRDEEIVALYEMVFQNNILLVYGASGTGKTSLIQCGLAGKFKSYDWLALTIRRGTNINTSLEKILTDAGGDALDEEDMASNDPSHKVSTLQRLLKGVYLTSFKPIYLIFDQFEELYILGTKEEQEKFIESVKEILKAEQPVKMIFSIREEYLGHLFEFEKEVPQLLRKKLRVESMTQDKVTDVIKGINNFKLSNVRIKEDQVTAITQGIFERLKGKKKTLTIQLPYLQVFLDKLYLETTKDESRKADALIELSVLNSIGDIGDVLRNFLEEQVTGISQKLSNNNNNVSPETIWKILSPFSTLEGTKEPISKKELRERLKDIDPKLIDEAVESFVNSRILNFSEAANLYELAHDSLALRIAEKRSDEEISLLEVRKLIKNQVALKQDARELFSKKQLNFIEPYIPKLNLSEEELALVTQSKEADRKAEKKKRTRRKTIIISIAAVTVLIVAGLSYFLIEQSIAKNKNIELLSNNYWNNTKNDRSKSDYVYALANAAKAISLTRDTNIIKKILIDIEHQWPIVKLNNIISDKSQISASTYSSDSNVIITASNDFIIREWNAKTGMMISSKELEAKPKKNNAPKKGFETMYTKGTNANQIVGFTVDGKKIITLDSGYLRLSLLKDGKKDPQVKFDSIEYSTENPPSFNWDGTKMITHDGNSEDFMFYDFVSKTVRKIQFQFPIPNINQYSYANYYGPAISNLVLDSTGNKFLFLLNNTRLFMGNTDQGKIYELALDDEIRNPIDTILGIDSLRAKLKEKSKRYKAPLNSVAFGANENNIITAGKDSSIRFWNIDTVEKDAIKYGQQDGKILKLKKPAQLAYMIPGNPDKIFTKDEDGTTYLWDRKNPDMPLGHAVLLNLPTSSLCFRKDGKEIMVVENNSVFLWDILLNNNTRTQKTSQEELPNPAYSHDMSKIVIADTIKNSLVFQLLEAETRSQIGSNMRYEKELEESQLNDVIEKGIKIFSPDNKKLLTTIGDSVMLLWDLEKQKQIGGEIDFYLGGLNQEVSISAIFSPDSKKILVYNSDSTASIINAETGKKIGKKIPSHVFTDHPDKAIISRQVVFNTDSTRILTHDFYEDGSDTNNDGEITSDDSSFLCSSIQNWDIQSGKKIGKEIAYKRKADSILLDEVEEEGIKVLMQGMRATLGNKPPVFSPNGKSFLTYFKYNSICQIWDTEKGTQIGDDIVFKNLWVPFFARDGKSILASVNDSIVRYFDAKTGKPTSDSIIHWSSQTPPIISPDGKQMLTFQKDGSLELLDSKTGKEINAGIDFKHQTQTSFFYISPVFSPNGSQFLTADQSGFLRLWNAKTGKQKGPALKHRSSDFYDIAFSPDGKKILSSCFDMVNESETAIIWDAETGKQISEEISITGFEAKFGYNGKLIAFYDRSYSFEGEVSDESKPKELMSIEKGDLDIFQDRELLQLQVDMMSGYTFDFETNEKIALTSEEFRKTKEKYNTLAAKHYKTCSYYNYNRWKLFNPEEAKKIRQVAVWGKKTITADQFTILPEFQIGDTTIKENNGRFLTAHQAILSKNGEYMLAYQKDGDLVIYKIEGMEPIWATGTFGYPTYRTVMQFDGNLVIYFVDPGTILGNNVAWSSNTWENNAGATLKLEDDGTLVIYNTNNEVVWDNIRGKVTETYKSKEVTETNKSKKVTDTTKSNKSNKYK